MGATSSQPLTKGCPCRARRRQGEYAVGTVQSSSAHSEYTVQTYHIPDRERRAKPASGFRSKLNRPCPPKPEVKKLTAEIKAYGQRRLWQKALAVLRSSQCQMEVNVVLVGAHAAPLHDLHRHRPAHHVAGRQVLGARSVPESSMNEQSWAGGIRKVSQSVIIIVLNPLGLSYLSMKRSPSLFFKYPPSPRQPSVKRHPAP